ncbi:unnamed protein product [Microthlaspi erraticum]|uniref:Glycylpeptide N-tetradecanoyltransferase n=1 Tax=Microthlaspi erraticum TaxID=1685480 RepID=A0A6D2JKS1_9BRAS|nr:unnamed protein product [Microthlaspi erraticum]
MAEESKLDLVDATEKRFRTDPSPKPEYPNSKDALKEMESGNSALNDKVKKKKNKGKGKESEDTEFTTKLPTVMKKSKGKYKIESPYEWITCMISSDDMCAQVGKLLKDNYSSVGACDYSNEFLRWALQPPGYRKDWLIGVRVMPSSTLVGFISAVPAMISVDGDLVEMAEINIVCVKKDHRNKGICTAMIKELTTRVGGGHTALINYKHVPTSIPTVTCQYWNNTLIHVLPTGGEVVGERFREMKPDDVPSVTHLLNGYLSRFRVRPVFDEDTVSHWFLPRQGIVSSFVRASGEKLTDFGSFYWQRVNQRVDKKLLNIKYGCMFYYASVETVENVIRYLVKVARESNLDAFSIVRAMELEESFLTKLHFEKGDSFHYHLPSCVTGVDPLDIGLLIKALE